MMMQCDNSDPQLLDVLYATEMLDRVYPQTNIYFSECIQGANFVYVTFQKMAFPLSNL